MKIYLGDLTLPNYLTLTEINTPNSTENVTLDGTLYVDFVNQRRGWRIGWKLLESSDYDNIRSKYNEQYTNGSFHYFGIPEYGINVPVYMKINDKNIKYNGQLIEGFSIELYEQDAIS